MKALLSDDIDAMNYYMNQIIMTTFSYFDVGQNEPERFYHGFVLGLIADQTDIKVRNIKREEIHHYGFAFEGKKVLIG